MPDERTLGGPDAFDPPQLARSSKVDLVLAAVRQGILHGDLRPGQPLVLAELSSKFGISPGPLREALSRLQGEGLVDLRPSRTAVVAPIDSEDLRQIYRLRISIEGDLIALAGKQYSDAQIERLDELNGTLGLENGDRLLLADNHTAIHRLLLEPAASPWDWRILDILWAASGRYLMLVFEQLRDRRGSEALSQSHVELLDAARSRSPRGLRRALVAHLEEGVDTLTQALNA